MTRSLALLVAVAALGCAAGSLLDPNGYAVRILCLVFLLAAMAQAWNIVGGLANQISLGHGAFFGIGAYASTSCQVAFGLSPWLGLPVGMAGAALFALLLSLPTVRLKGPYFALATLAAAEVCKIVAGNLAITGGSQGLSVPFRGSSLASMQFRQPGPYLPLLVGLFCAVSLVFAALSSGRVGYFLRAIRDDEQAAEVAGVATLRTKLLGSALSAALTAACGTAFAQFTFFIDPDTVFSAGGVSIRMALVAIVGGVGTLVGPLAGALVVVPVEEFLNGALAESAAGLAPLLFGVVLIAIILLRPEGIASLLPRRGFRRASE